MNRKLSEKDKKDWQNFISSNKKIENKDLKININKIEKKIVKKLDLHSLSLINANTAVEEFVSKCFDEKVNKIIIITGKGSRSKNKENPYVSGNLGILRYSVPEFIKSNENLKKIVKEIKEASVQDGGEGAFYIYLKN